MPHAAKLADGVRSTLLVSDRNPVLVIHLVSVCVIWLSSTTHCHKDFTLCDTHPLIFHYQLIAGDLGKEAETMIGLSSAWVVTF